MRNIILFIILFTLSTCAYAQSDTLSNDKLLTIYNNNIDFLKKKKSVILNDSVVSSTDFKNILILKQNKYNSIADIENISEKKRFLLEEINDLNFFIENYNTNRQLAYDYLKKNINEVNIYTKRIDTLKNTSGMETCTKCLFRRKVRFIALKVDKNKIDTVNCVILKYTKLGFQNRKIGGGTEFTSFPCTKTKEISLNGDYGKNVIEVFFDKKKYKMEFVIGVGKSENDIFTLPLILDNKYLTND